MDTVHIRGGEGERDRAQLLFNRSSHAKLERLEEKKRVRSLIYEMWHHTVFHGLDSSSSSSVGHWGEPAFFSKAPNGLCPFYMGLQMTGVSFTEPRLQPTVN